MIIPLVFEKLWMTPNVRCMKKTGQFGSVDEHQDEHSTTELTLVLRCSKPGILLCEHLHAQ